MKMSSFNASWEAIAVENGKVNTALKLPTIKILRGSTPSSVFINTGIKLLCT